MKIKHTTFFTKKESEAWFGSVSPKFSLGNRNKNEITPICVFGTCRESLSFALREKIKYGKINARILRLIVWFSSSSHPTKVVNKKIIKIDEKQYFDDANIENNKKLLTAIHTLNMIEKELKWRRSTIQKLEHKLSNRHNFHLVSASPRWMFSPPLISLYLLILRSGVFTDISESKSIKEFAAKCEGISDRASFRSDAEHLKLFAPKLQKFLANVDSIYEKRTQKINFSKAVLPSGINGFSEGMLKLVNADTGDKHILKRFKKYTKKGKFRYA